MSQAKEDASINIDVTLSIPAESLSCTQHSMQHQSVSAVLHPTQS